MKGIVMIMMVMFVGFSYGQSQVVTIQTSAECGQCKDRIENALNYTKGINYAELDLETKKVEVKFNSKKISLVDVKQLIAETGYSADEVKAMPEAVENLPACCKPGGMEK